MSIFNIIIIALSWLMMNDGAVPKPTKLGVRATCQ
jgi:predicted DNA-binding transcriptional regulator AlpA